MKRNVHQKLTQHCKSTVCARSLGCFLTLCDPMDCSPPGSLGHGIFQARILKWLPLPTPGDLPDPSIEPTSLASPALAGGFFSTSTTWEAQKSTMLHLKKCCSKAWVYPGPNYKVDVIYLSYYHFTFRIVPFSENTGFFNCPDTLLPSCSYYLAYSIPSDSLTLKYKCLIKCISCSLAILR